MMRAHGLASQPKQLRWLTLHPFVVHGTHDECANWRCLAIIEAAIPLQLLRYFGQLLPDLQCMSDGLKIYIKHHLGLHILGDRRCFRCHIGLIYRYLRGRSLHSSIKSVAVS